MEFLELNRVSSGVSTYIVCNFSVNVTSEHRYFLDHVFNKTPIFNFEKELRCAFSRLKLGFDELLVDEGFDAFVDYV